jgi:hypothetical protein
MAWVSKGAKAGGGWSKRLLCLALRQGDGSAVFANEAEVGALDELGATSLVNAVEDALSICGPTRLTAERNAWHVTLCEGAKHPANWQDAYALGGSYEELISVKLKRELSLITDLLERNILTGMPFDIFGIFER